ncbi:MAG TPA: FAD-dependent oxidoreductase, partial [Chitinophagaceae bacterium]|nr:FAD-dependent oxidoreductase [Chitinophagaceae bacterium]
GIIRQGLKWMMSSSSPFYIKPRLNMDLLRWGLRFRKSATARHVEESGPHLNNLLQLTRQLMSDLKTELPSFDMVEKGCWMLYKQEKTADHEKHLADQAAAYGLKTIICTQEEVQQYETEVEVTVRGGVLYIDDCHVSPAGYMRALYQQLQQMGVKFWLNTEVKGFETKNGSITAVLTADQALPVGELVIANGSWMGLIAKKLGISILMQPGKGYSVIYDGLQKNLQYPSILVDDRTATAPIGSWLRIGGTMELSGHSDTILPKRVTAIYNAFKKYYPGMPIAAPDTAKAWYGYRPVSPDGMPYIGRHSRYSNLIFAGGHAMLGVSAAAGTGLLVNEMVQGRQPSIPLTAFSPERFC